MNVKKRIKDELDKLIVIVATAYNELITEDIPDRRFEETVDVVSKAKDQAEENFVSLANDIVVETVLATEEAAKKKSDRLSKLVPGITIPQESPPEVAEIPVAPIRPAAKLEGPAMPLPRDVSGNLEGMPPNMHQLVEQAEAVATQSMSGGVLDGGMGVDIDPNVKVNHDLGMTVAEENRAKAGLPIKINRPTIHVTGKPLNMNPVPAPTAASATPKAATPYEEALKKIGRLAAEHSDSDNEELAKFAFKVLTVVEVTLGVNFTEAPGEAENV